jgi:hypothetical protein
LEIKQVGHNVFKVTFPNKMELERMQVLGTYMVPNTEIKLKVDHCLHALKPISSLPEGWIYVTGITPTRKGDFLALWSLGSLFGKTLIIDMPFTREHDVRRIQIGCLDQESIPEKLNVFVGDGLYELTFEVEADESEDPMLEDNFKNNRNNPDNDRGGNGNDVLEKTAENGNDSVSPAEGSNLNHGNVLSGSAPAPSTGAENHGRKVGVSFSPKLQWDIIDAKSYLSSLYAKKVDVLSWQGDSDGQAIQDEMGPVNHSLDISAGAEKSPSLSAAAANPADLAMELDSLSIQVHEGLENKVEKTNLKEMAADDECCTPTAARFQEFPAEESTTARVSPTFSTAMPSSVLGSLVISAGALPASQVATNVIAGKDLLCAEEASLHSPGIMKKTMAKSGAFSREDVVAFGGHFRPDSDGAEIQ